MRSGKPAFSVQRARIIIKPLQHAVIQVFRFADGGKQCCPCCTLQQRFRREGLIEDKRACADLTRAQYKHVGDIIGGRPLIGDETQRPHTEATFLQCVVCIGTHQAVHDVPALLRKPGFTLDQFFQGKQRQLHAQLGLEQGFTTRDLIRLINQ